MERTRKNLENFVSLSECPTKAKKKSIIRKVKLEELEKAKFEELEKACYLRFSQQRSKGALQCQDLY